MFGRVGTVRLQAIAHLHDCVSVDDDFDRVTAEEEDDDGDEGDGGADSLPLLAAQPDRHALKVLESEGERQRKHVL